MANSENDIQISGVKISHPDKIMYPGFGVTKHDVAEYYAEAAKLIVPFLKGRPVTLVRSPEGVKKGSFYQRHPGEYFPDYINRVKIHTDEGTEIYVSVDAEEDLVYLANQGVLEFHAWGSTAKNEDRPDMLIWDFDPGQGAPWSSVVTGALLVHDILDKLNLKSFVKVSGSKGLHVYLPIQPKLDWDKAKQFTLEVANTMVSMEPKLFTTEIRKDERKGKVFIDYLRNTKGGTAVSPFSLRAKDKPAISMPIKWSEVTEKLQPNAFLIPETKLKSTHPWQGFFATNQKLPI